MRECQEIYSYIGMRLQLAREDVEMSLSDLARVTETPLRLAERYELAGEHVSIGWLESAARALGVPIQYFFAGYVPH